MEQAAPSDPGRIPQIEGGQNWFPGKRESKQWRLAQPPRFPYSRLHPQPPKGFIAPISSLTWFFGTAATLPFPFLFLFHSFYTFLSL
jgi:hypothetical protein